jgi:glutaredoxin
MMMRFALLLTLLCFGAAAFAQQYRWVDEQGRPHYSGTPPAKAKAVTKTEAKAASQPEEPPPPYEVQRLLKDFPVTLYTAPSCDDHCDKARATLNKRGIPFTEVPVVTADTLAKVKALTGAEAVPVLVVGRRVFNGYEPSSFQSLLDSAGYPKEGTVPARSQRAPVVPAPTAAGSPPVAEPAESTEAATTGRGRYDTSGLKSNRVDRPGRYVVPGAEN